MKTNKPIFPKKAIYKSKSKNMISGSLQDGEIIEFSGNCSKPSMSKTHAFYARPSEKWNTHLLSINDLKDY